jgi:hypothetical protein
MVRSIQGTAATFLTLALLLTPDTSFAAKRSVFVFGCTSDRLAARIRITADAADLQTIGKAFARLVSQYSSRQFIAMKTDARSGNAAFAKLNKASGGKIPAQDLEAIARSIAVNKRKAEVRKHCGG